MANEITSNDDVIDSRDVIARIEELEGERADLAADPDAPTDEERAAIVAWDDGAEGSEYQALKALAGEAEGYAPDWQHGETLIRDSYFVEYVQDLLEDIGDLPKNLPSYIAIDWNTTAKNIQVDYTSVEFDGVTYWIR